MGWERQKIGVEPLPKTPSAMRWMMSAIIAMIICLVLFVLHTNTLAGVLQPYDIWTIAVSPLLVWLLLLSLRGWVYGRACGRHQFAIHEANDAQKRWEAWSGRHLALLHSGVMLSEGITPGCFLSPPPGLEHSSGMAKRVALPDNQTPFTALLPGINDVLMALPSEVTPVITLLTDAGEAPDILQVAFADAWQSVCPAISAPPLTIQTSRSLLTVEERLKTPAPDVELLLIDQRRGGDAYSDALALLLLTSDDVAAKYRLNHRARLLRPMPLDPTKEAGDEFELFFSTQPQATATGAIIGDAIAWGCDYPTLLSRARDYGGGWQPQQCHWLEKYAGLSGPFSPWITIAAIGDIVALTRVGCLMLSGDSAGRYIATVTTGDTAAP